jgi:hypothetical protein
MAKSTRSKVKRSFRSKKREDSVYAATAAARVHRLSAKLRAIASIEEGNAGAMDEDEEGRDQSPGWSWFAAFGLLDADDISADIMGASVGWACVAQRGHASSILRSHI